MDTLFQVIEMMITISYQFIDLPWQEMDLKKNSSFFF